MKNLKLVLISSLMFVSIFSLYGCSSKDEVNKEDFPVDLGTVD